MGTIEATLDGDDASVESVCTTVGASAIPGALTGGVYRSAGVLAGFPASA